MFIGHYGPAVWDAHRVTGVRLWHGFLAVQAIDVLSMLFTILNLEGANRPQGAHPLAFDIPWSHSLLSAVVVSFLVAGLYRLLRPQSGRKAVAVMGLLTFSHWPLDWLVHRPDLPLYPGSEVMLGLGLWNYPWPTYFLETVLLAGMIAWWLSVTKGKIWTVVGAWLFVLILTVLQYSVIVEPTLLFQENGTLPPPAGIGQAVSGLVAFLVFAGFIAVLERGRQVKPSRP